MSLQVFVLLPDNDEAILGIGEQESDFQIFLTNTLFLLKRIKQQQDATLYYDEENFATFLEKCQDVTTATYLQKPANMLRQTLGKTAREIKNNPYRQQDCHYFTWKIDESFVTNANHIVSEIAERIYQFPDNVCLLIIFANTLSTRRAFLTVFKDAPHIHGLPDKFVHIPFVTDQDELEIWLATHHQPDFSLLNKNRFQRTSMVSQGKPIFRELTTGCFWYLDNLHKNEYEVFNSQYQHIGVANLEGEIDYSKKVAGRTI